LNFVETVRGPLAVEDLGATLMHEHIFILNPELLNNYPHPEWNENAQVKRAQHLLTELADRGISTIVDLTVMGLGRCIPLIQRVAAGSRVNIVAATGYYTKRDLPAYFQSHGPGLRVEGPEPLVEMFRRDILDGIANTNVKAGVIKVTTDLAGITPDIERVLRAAAMVHQQTNVPISTHASVENFSGRTQQMFFAENGVDLRRVVIGHCGDTTDIDYLVELMDKGSTIGLDRFGMDWLLPEDKRIDTLVRLCERGYADRIVLSHDACVFSLNTEPSYRDVHTPTWNYANITDRVLPRLHERGISEAVIAQMMTANPARILAR
jgi:phosphotriesterase-related protein